MDQTEMRTFMNGSALQSADVETGEHETTCPKTRISNDGLIHTALKRVSSSVSTNTGGRSSLSVNDANTSVMGGVLRRSARKGVSGSVATSTADGSQLSLKFQNNLIQSVKKSLAKTKKQWDRTGFIHIIYVLTLLAYSFLGGGLFMALDGPHADRLLNNHRNRCVEERERLWDRLVLECSNLSFTQCENQTRYTLLLLDHCLRTAPQVPFNYSTSDYWNSLIYAITVFTTIGYGNIVVMSTEGRVAMVLYAMVGIPLFFAFLNDMGQWFHFKFLKIFAWLRRMWSRSRLRAVILDMRRRRRLTLNPNAAAADALDAGGTPVKNQNDDKESQDSLIFTFAVCVLVFYLVVVCGFLVVVVRGQWSFFQAFYFLFQSISLIGFGDEFPEDPKIVLVSTTFIIIGIILLSMCFFILQEWIRGKTYRLSAQVRRSVRRWTHYAYRPTVQSIQGRRRLKSARFAIPHLGSPSELWKHRIDENVAGQRLAVVDDSSPGPGRRPPVAIFTFEEDEDQDEEASAIQRPSLIRQTGVHSVDESLITGPKWSSKSRLSAADGTLEAEDAVFLRPVPLAYRRSSERRHTVMCVDEIPITVLDEPKRTPSWLKEHRTAASEKKQKSSKVQKHLSFHDRPARFGKFQWIRQTHDEEEDEDEDEEDGEEVEDVLLESETTKTDTDHRRKRGSECFDKDEYL